MNNQLMMTMWSYLPEELVEKILVRAAIKTLLRMRSVCKRWNNLICTSQFIYANLNFTKLIDNSSRYLIVYPKWYYRNGKTGFKLQCVVCYEGKSGNFGKYQINEFPTDEFVVDWSIISCNGVVCLHVTLSLDPAQNDVFLWNPMIRRFLHLPKSSVEWKSWRLNYAFGFVFDRVTNDYKVLRIYTGLCGKTSLIEIFRLSNGLWEVITHASPLDYIYRISRQVDLEGIAHWIGRGNGELKIVTFDMHEEVFGSIGLPVKEGESFEPVMERYLFVFEKSLFLIEHVGTYMNVRWRKNRFCVWRMNEYGIVESWTRLRKFVFEMMALPLGFRMNGEVLWSTESRKLFSTNLEDGLQIYCNTFETATCALSSSDYVESLVLLDHPLSTSAPVFTLEESIIL